MSLAAEVIGALERARALGDIGPVDLDVAWMHSLGFRAGVGADPVGVVDLGSGGGLPSFPLISSGWGRRWLLVEARSGRASRLAGAADALGWGDRVDVVHGRAEDVARLDWRGTADVVTARAFGSPAVTAECGVGFLRIGGLLVVSEPPVAPAGRWPESGLGKLGLVSEDAWEVGGGHFRSFRLVSSVMTEWPRRAGGPRKRPLF